MWMCIDVCLGAVWTPPHNSTQPIFCRSLYRSRCQAVWTRNYKLILQNKFIFSMLPLSIGLFISFGVGHNITLYLLPFYWSWRSLRQTWPREVAPHLTPVCSPPSHPSCSYCCSWTCQVNSRTQESTPTMIQFCTHSKNNNLCSSPWHKINEKDFKRTEIKSVYIL